MHARNKIRSGACRMPSNKRDLLCKEFLRVLCNYRCEFERWELPSDGKLWFEKIFSNPPNNPLTARLLENAGANYFSQPHTVELHSKGFHGTGPIFPID